MSAKPSVLLLALFLPVGCREEPPPSPPREYPVAPVPVEPFAMGQPDVVLLVTGSTDGQLEDVSCCGVLPGGLSGRSGLFRSYEAAFPQTVRVDTGDAFWADERDPRNEFVLRGYRLAGYDAVVLGQREWRTGPQRLGRLLAGEGPAWLSTTLRPAGGQPPVPVQQVVRLDRGGVKLAFVSDVPREANSLSAEEANRLAFAPKGESSRLARQEKAEGCVVVLVSHAPPEDLAALVRDAQPDLLLRGHVSQSDANLGAVAGCPVVQVGGGDRVGVVAMKVSAAAPSRIASLEYRLETLDNRWPMDDRMVRLYQAYERKAAVRWLDARRTAPIEYVAASECGRCHARQYDLWKGTDHAKAYDILVREKRQDDPDCLTCHTTGMGQPGGFESIGRTPQHANVNCQECHRFGVAEHQRPDFRPKPVPEAACRACHTRLNSHIDELYDEMRKQVSH